MFNDTPRYLLDCESLFLISDHLPSKVLFIICARFGSKRSNIFNPVPFGIPNRRNRAVLDNAFDGGILRRFFADADNNADPGVEGVVVAAADAAAGVVVADSDSDFVAGAEGVIAVVAAGFVSILLSSSSFSNSVSSTESSVIPNTIHSTNALLSSVARPFAVFVSRAFAIIIFICCIIYFIVS